MCKCKKSKAKGKKKKCLLGKLLALLALAYGALFAVFYFDLDGKLLFYVVEPFLKKHYDNMPRKDVMHQQYDVDKYPQYEY